MKHKKLSIALIAVLVALSACWAYVSNYYHADDAALAAMSPTSHVQVEQQGSTIAFIPEQAVAGFIFYPGGKVEFTAYAPLMQALAKNDVLCVLVEMPFNLAVLDVHAASGIPAQYPQVEHWYIGGHSLGGSMAASHVATDLTSFDGLVLLASYSTANLSQSSLPIISLYGSADGVLDMTKYEQYKANLPASYQEHVIVGGCHAGFGSYGPQDGDGIPTISSEAQIEQTARLLTEFFQ